MHARSIDERANTPPAVAAGRGCHCGVCRSVWRSAAKLYRRSRNDDGSNVLEGALILPLILLLLCGLMDFAGFLFTRMALQNGVSQATRYAITRNTLSNVGREDSIRSVLRENTPRLTIADADISFSHQLPGGNAWLAGTGPPESIERVVVTHRWQVMTPIMERFFPPGGVTIRVESAMKNESQPFQ